MNVGYIIFLSFILFLVGLAIFTVVKKNSDSTPENVEGGGSDETLGERIRRGATSLLAANSRVQTTGEISKTADLSMLINMLPTGARTIFNLYTIEGYKHNEIAKMLSISEGTSKSQLSKAKNVLRELVTKYYER